MPKIFLLDPTVADQIAAGEVVERPSSVVKELVENALDAGARRVRVELEQAGRALIRVSDDGEGMDREDLALSVKRHATSKIRAAADLQSLAGFGFRGEALPSIASVSLLSITTRAAGAPEAWRLDVEGGLVSPPAPAGRAQGSTVEARRLFYNTPARLKFLKSDSTESGRVVQDLSQMALARPDVAFELLQDGRAALELPAAAEPSERLRRLWGASLASAALAVDHAEGGLGVKGWVAPPSLGRGNRSGQWLYVNGRVVEHRQLGFHLSQAYGPLLPHGRHAVAALFITLPPDAVDVNVHPAKREVRFTREASVWDCLRHGVVQALREARLFAELPLGSGGQGRPYGVPAWGGAGGVGSGSAAYGVVSEGAGAERASVLGEASTLGEPAGLPFSGPAGAVRPISAGSLTWTLPGPAPIASRQDWPVPLAQLHRSYLLCQDSRGLVVVDQHAAHERVLYERQLRAFAQGELKSQRLLLPQRLQLNAEQSRLLEARVPALAQLGLELENVGGGLFFLSSLPEFLKLAPASGLIQDLLEPTDEVLRSGNPEEDFRRGVAAGLACRAAIKAGEPMTGEAMLQLMADLAACETPWCCPHGRPPLVRVSLAELEKHFQRR